MVTTPRLTLDSSLDALINLNELLAGTATGTDDIELLATALDNTAVTLVDIEFWRSVYTPLGDVGHTDAMSVSRAIKQTVAQLRLISVFRMGEITAMKRFCSELNDRLLSDAWSDLRSRLAA